MNEFEKLEAELKELRPIPTSEEFTGRLEKALGDAGRWPCVVSRMKMRQIKNGPPVPHSGNLPGYYPFPGLPYLQG